MDELNLKITIVGLVGFAVLTLLVILFVITIIRNHRIKVNIERDQILKDIQLLEKERSRCRWEDSFGQHSRTRTCGIDDLLEQRSRWRDIRGWGFRRFGWWIKTEGAA